MKLLDLFQKKKKPREPQQVEQSKETELGQKVDAGEVLQPVDTIAKGKVTLEELEASLSLQKAKVDELRNSVRSYQGKQKDVRAAMSQLDKQKREYKDRESEFNKVLGDSRLLPKSREDIKQELKAIRRALFEIDSAVSANKKIMSQLDEAIRKSSRAIKINEKAIRENERVLKIVRSSNEGAVEIKQKRIEDVEKEVLQDESAQKIKDDALVAAEASVEQTVIPAIKEGFGKMTEDDYWEKGRIQGK